MAQTLIFPFSVGDRTQSDLLGGKGANLSEMVKLGLPVPPGFTITTEACREYLKTNKLPAQLTQELDAAISALEKDLGREFGNPDKPLLVSVRSGAKFSMPGMMETVLNVGITPEVAAGLAKISGNERFAWDSFRRFIEMFGRIVHEVDTKEFHKTEMRILEKNGAKNLQELDAAGLKALVRALSK